MSRVEDYRKNARDCRELASRTPAEQGQQLLDIAAEWETLAEECERILTARADDDS